MTDLLNEKRLSYKEKLEQFRKRVAKQGGIQKPMYNLDEIKSRGQLLRERLERYRKYAAKPGGNPRSVIKQVKTHPDDIHQMETSNIITEERFSTLFTIETLTLDLITDRIKSEGYDKSKPIVVWKKTVIDGHARLKAAKQAGLKNVWVLDKSFQNEAEALMYAIKNQRDQRKSLKDSDVLGLVEKLDRLCLKGEDPRNLEVDSTNDSFENTAKLIGVRASKVQRVMKILKHEDTSIRKQVFAGALSLNRAVKLIVQTNPNSVHKQFRSKAQ